MPENDRVNGCLDEFEVGFVEREATPRLLMKLGIQLHLATLSLSNIVSIIEIFGVQRARSTIHNWVHKADLQPEAGRCPDHVAVDETVIQLGDERYWLYAVVDPDSNKLLHTKLEPVRTNGFAHAFFGELREKHDVDTGVFLVDGATPLQDACARHGLDFRYERHGNRNSVGRIFREVERRNLSFSNYFRNAKNRNCRRVVEIVRLRMESAYLNSTVGRFPTFLWGRMKVPSTETNFLHSIIPWAWREGYFHFVMDPATSFLCYETPVIIAGIGFGTPMNDQSSQ